MAALRPAEGEALRVEMKFIDDPSWGMPGTRPGGRSNRK